jgi:hypothetical protein
MANVRVCLINTIVVGTPGESVIAFGHTLTIQPNGEAHGDIHEDFVPGEVGAGRFRIVGDENKSIPAPRKDMLSGFGTEIKDYFGSNTLKDLYEKIKALKEEEVILFAETRLNLGLPASMSKDRMVKEISKIIEASNVGSKVEPEKEKESGKEPQQEQKQARGRGPQAKTKEEPAAKPDPAQSKKNLEELEKMAGMQAKKDGEK